MTADPHPRAHAVDSDWISVTQLPYGVSRVRTSSDGGALAVRAYGGGDPRPGDWGETGADGVFALKAGSGYAFTATFAGAAVSSHLQTNLVHGVMAVHAFHRFTDGSGRRDYFTREFYVPVTGDRDRDAATKAPGGFPEALSAGVNHPGGLLGTWTVLDPANANISAIECAQTSGEFTVRAFGAPADGLADWGATRARLYADAAKPYGRPAFLTTFALADRRLHLQARDYNGILVAAQYIEFTDGSGRPDYFTRDCFRR